MPFQLIKLSNAIPCALAISANVSPDFTVYVELSAFVSDAACPSTLSSWLGKIKSEDRLFHPFKLSTDTFLSCEISQRVSPDWTVYDDDALADVAAPTLKAAIAVSVTICFFIN